MECGCYAAGEIEKGLTQISCRTGAVMCLDLGLSDGSFFLTFVAGCWLWVSFDSLCPDQLGGGNVSPRTGDAMMILVCAKEQ